MTIVVNLKYLPLLILGSLFCINCMYGLIKHYIDMAKVRKWNKSESLRLQARDEYLKINPGLPKKHQDIIYSPVPPHTIFIGFIFYVFALVPYRLVLFIIYCVCVLGHYLYGIFIWLISGIKIEKINFKEQFISGYNLIIKEEHLPFYYRNKLISKGFSSIQYYCY